MSEKISGLTLSTNRDHDGFSPYSPEKQRFVYVDAETALNRFPRLRRTYAEIAAQSQYPKHIIYPAGNADIFPLLMPFASSLIIADLVPFLTPIKNYRGNSDEYSPLFYRILEEHKDAYIGLDTFHDSKESTPTVQTMVIEDIKHQTGHHLDEQIYTGYHSDPRSSLARENNNFARIIGSLVIMGVDLRSLQLGSFDNEYRLKFVLDGEEKLLAYRNQKIGTYTGSKPETFQGLRADGEKITEGKTALLVKADFQRVSPFAIEIVDPDIIIKDGDLRNPFRGHDVNYVYMNIPSPTFPNLPWGYGEVKDIKIGTKRT